ncbi:hypothetical protein QEJ31_03190 [Pigmentibacter sp. JX0631]|uniref:hypothetical protein n=1 Tax=Pigmentibacter sp. JX0631 TaxID=2976982 RepID=UPI0024697444|nr:hypothetical protein [Pigmentibacter sp. JX0631]WGL60606.1 hypothetical protein QEJ31_03190 [Pigmentibacter sp. JX0631]
MFQDFAVSRLNKLSFQQIKAYKNYEILHNYDNISHLDQDLIDSWKKLIASIATTEGIEDLIISNIMLAFTKCEKKLNFLRSQKSDESIHTIKLINYNLQTFKYKKLNRSFADKIIYDIFLKKLSKLFPKKPIYGLVLLQFFEIYGVNFYKKLSLSAKNFNLFELEKLINQISKDEERHITGISIIISEELKTTKISFFDILLIKLIISLCVFDINMNKYAYHNKTVRNNILKLGMNPNELTQFAKKTAKVILRNLINTNKN